MVDTSNKAQQYRFNENNWNPPDVPQQNGQYALTDYTAAETVYSFMRKNNTELDSSQFVRGAWFGKVQVGLKAVQLTPQEQAAFKKMGENHAALWNRLDAGTMGTHDNRVGWWDVSDAIKKGTLHGSDEHSPYWTNQNSSMSNASASQKLTDFLKSTFGSGWTNLSKDRIKEIASSQGVNSGKGWVAVDDPAVVRAAGVLSDHWDKVQISDSKTLTPAELKKLSTI
jgi:hypothetical protein